MELNDNGLKLVKEYVRDRDAATIAVVEGESVEVFKAFVSKYHKLGFFPPCFTLPSDKVLEISIRKMAIHEIAAPDSTKQKAASWLLERGYDLNLD